MKATGIRPIRLADIDVTERLRPIDQGYAALIAENIRECGRLRQPIMVRMVKDGRFKLIAGAHRLRAVEMLGWTEIEASVFRITADEARLMEVDDNLVRHDLNALDRAVFLATRKAIYEAMHPETKHGGAPGKAGGGKKAKECTLSGFAKDTAARCGMDRSTISRAVRIAVQLPPDLRSRLAGSRIARRQAELLALVKVPPAQRSAVVDLLLNEPATVRTVRDAVQRLAGGPRISHSEAKKLAALRKAWDGADKAARRAWLSDLEHDGGTGELARLVVEIAPYGTLKDLLTKECTMSAAGPRVANGRRTRVTA